MEYLSPGGQQCSEMDYDEIHHPPGRFDLGPGSCEYCGSDSTERCQNDGSCSRPRLYFLKKRPPFATDWDGWDRETEFRANPFERPPGQSRGDYYEGLGMGNLGGGARYLSPGPTSETDGKSVGDSSADWRRGQGNGDVSDVGTTGGGGGKWRTSLSAGIAGSRRSEGSSGWITSLF